MPVGFGFQDSLRRIAHGYFWSWPPGVVALWPWWPKAALAHFAAAHVLAIYSALRPNSQIFGKVVQHFAPRGREVWLTIDDGPFAADTAAMLGVLERHSVPATFFVQGTRVQDDPSLARRVVEAGHTLGNHSHTHPSARFWASTSWGARRELEDCSEAIREAAAVEPIGFRAPVGMANGLVHARARRAGLPVIGWSARAFDTVDPNMDRVLRRIMKHVVPGAIVVLHQRSSPACRGARLLATLLTELHTEGFRCVVPDRERWR